MVSARDVSRDILLFTLSILLINLVLFYHYLTRLTILQNGWGPDELRRPIEPNGEQI